MIKKNAIKSTMLTRRGALFLRECRMVADPAVMLSRRRVRIAATALKK